MFRGEDLDLRAITEGLNGRVMQNDKVYPMEDIVPTERTDRVPVLIVDDLPVNLFALRKQLAVLDQIEITEAGSAFEALELLINHSYALILLDVQMPGMDGFALADLLKVEGINVPIIFLTAFGKDIEQQLHGYDLGAVDYLCKPFHPSILLRKVQCFAALYLSRLRESMHRQFYKQTLDCAFEGVIRLNAWDQIDYINPEALRILSISNEATVLRKPIAEVLGELHQHRDGYELETDEFKRKQGQREGAPSSGFFEITRVDRKTSKMAYVSVSFSTVEKAGQYQGQVLMLKDITEIKEYQRNLVVAAQIDGMTGLYNRNFLQSYLNEAIQRIERQKHSLALLFVDLNDFKNVNDTLGHDMGDELLRQTADRLKNLVRKSDLVARLGGDEFVIVVEDEKDKILVTSHQVAKLTHDMLSEIFLLDETSVAISGAVGIAIYPEHGVEKRQLFEAADMAMYRAKHAGLPYEYYNPELRAQLELRSYITQSLKQSNLTDVLKVVFQPIVYSNLDRQSKARKFAVEALARWKLADRNISPEVFVKVAEEVGAINALTRSLAQQVGEQIANLKLGDQTLAYVSINISPLSLREPQLLEELLSLLQGYMKDLPGTRCCFEVVETNPLDFNERLSHCWNTVAKRGGYWAIDDFGSGYSSFKYFDEIPCQIVKLDRSITHGVTHGSKQFKILESITSMAHDLNLVVVAEGVEDAETLATVSAAGCDAIQGFYFAKPMNIDALQHFIDHPPKVA